MAECQGKVVFTSPQAAFDVCKHTPDAPIEIYKCASGHWHYGGAQKVPDKRHDTKQWKNWHWRKAVAETQGHTQ